MQVLRPNVRLGYLDVAIVKNSQNSRHAICHIFATMFCGSETCKQWSQKYLVSESRGVIVLGTSSPRSGFELLPIDLRPLRRKRDTIRRHKNRKRFFERSRKSIFCFF